MKPVYIGDGLFYEDDGEQVRLFTLRGGLDIDNQVCHEVFLDNRTLTNFLRAVEKSRDVVLKFQAKEVLTPEGNCPTV